MKPSQTKIVFEDLTDDEVAEKCLSSCGFEHVDARTNIQ